MANPLPRESEKLPLVTKPMMALSAAGIFDSYKVKKSGGITAVKLTNIDKPQLHPVAPRLPHTQQFPVGRAPLPTREPPGLQVHI
jgi:hypothetical protein